MNDRTPEFVSLLMQHERRIYGFIRGLVPNQADAEDVLQNTSKVLWQKFDHYQSGTDFAAWALATARWEVRQYLRARRNDRLCFSDDMVDLLADEASERREQLAGVSVALSGCLEKLPQPQRELLTRRYEPNVSVEALAGELGRPIQTVYSQLKRIRRALLDCVQRKLAAQGI